MDLSRMQHMIDQFSKDKGISSNLSVRIIDLTSEVGELSKEVLLGSDYGNMSFVKTENWESEIGDVLFSLICIANSTDTDLEKCVTHVLEKYKKRFVDNGGLGS